MDRAKVNLAVGLFVIVGIVAFAYLAVDLGHARWFGSRGYRVIADFPSVGDLERGSSVEIAGVDVGRVESVSLVDDEARVVLDIEPGVRLADDSIAAIKTQGLIGENYVSISPGGSGRVIPPNGKIEEVEPPVDLEELLARYVFRKG
jgi:phospholipid/cholesterol/gamma-HCH transport system substrate-binding protein